MNRSASIRHNAKILLGHVRGKSKADRWNCYANLMLGYLGPVSRVLQVWVNEKSAFEVNTSLTWAQARNR